MTWRQDCELHAVLTSLLSVLEEREKQGRLVQRTARLLVLVDEMRKEMTVDTAEPARDRP